MAQVKLRQYLRNPLNGYDDVTASAKFEESSKDKLLALKKDQRIRGHLINGARG